MITVGSLFSGIGGLDLGLEQAGMKTVWQVEFDDWARGKLDENFPHTEKFKDVREVGKHNLRPVDLICGGFPCTNVSNVNHHTRTGIDGEKSGLWMEQFRIFCELRPRYALIENVPGLITSGGFRRVLSDLASVGYDAEWQTFRAASFGLSSERKRLFIIAYPHSVGLVQNEIFNSGNHKINIPRPFPFGQYRVSVEAARRSYPQIPEHLRMDNGLSFELSEIEAAIKGYGNAVCPPVARFIGERIIEFDQERNEIGDSNETNN